MYDSGSLEVRWIQGFTNRSIDFVDNKTVCYKCANYICFLNLETKAQSVFQSPGRGIGALTANGNSGVFAFSEQKLSPSIFVYIYPALQMKNELKGAAQLDYTSLALSDGGPYLACCSSLPDHTITVWNWENAETICRQLQAGQDLISMVFNPLNWLQLCALGTTSLTLWNIEKSGSFHVLRSSKIDLPATDGSFVERMTPMSQTGNQLSYVVPDMPPPAISELSTVTNSCSRTRLTPTAICWTATSEVYVGCAEGFLLLIDPENLSVSVLINPTTGDAIPELTKGNFQGLTINKTGLITAGKDSSVHCLQIKGTEIDITQKWQLERPVTTVKCSPDDETLLLSSNTGQIYSLKPIQSDEVVKVLDVLSGDFVTAVFLHSDKNICVSLRHSGELQLWSSDGVCLSSLSLQTEVTALACCPIALYAAVGTASGNILFIDMNKEQQPRLVHQIHLYHTAVDHLVFDQKGHYLISSSSDSHIYVLDAKPSQMFSVIGYTVLPGSILSLSTQCISDCEEVKVLALCAGQEDKNQDGSVLTMFSLPTRTLRGPDCVDRHGCLSSQVLRVLRYSVPHPLQSCVLGISQVFAYCHERKALQRFQLPGVTDGFSSQQAIQLKPEQEVRAHLLGPASLILSPHHLWLASVGRDGLLQIRETESMEQYMELHCHSCHLGGVRSVSFSTDSLLLLTTGFTDGSLVCTNLRAKDVAAHKVKEATEHSQPVAHFLKKIFDTENSILDGLPAWERRVCGGPSVDVTEQDESYDILMCAPPSHPTWLESRREAVIKEDNEKFSETKKMLRETIRQLRGSIQIQELFCENENLPEEHFNLDVEEQKRLEVMAEEEVMRVRTEIEWDIAEKCYLHDVLKKEYWDSVKVKGRAIKTFHSELEVQNYPLREQRKKELEDLSRVQNTRRLENAALSSLKKSDSAQEKEEQGKDCHEAESTALTGSFSTQLGYSNPYIYDQFSLQTTEQRINQIILLQDTIHRIKMGFNADFDVLYSQKVQELKRIKDRNRQIREIMQDLNMNEELWEPSLTTSEWPESLLHVDDSEIKAERFLTPEQRQEEERKKLEEQSRLAAQVDECRERGLDDMMDGVLEVKKEDILKEIPPPEFVLTKPEIQWSEEEKRAYKEYEKKSQKLSEEREKYRKSLETEMKKLQESTKEATERFDEALTKLLETKVKCTVAIYQEELKITYLVDSVLMEEEMRNQELELKLKLEKMLAYKEEIGEVVRTHEEEVELFHQAYETLVGEDKVLDKEFRKEFFDVPSSMVDYLYKLFKRRPRVQKMRTQSDNNSSLFKDPRLCGSLAPDGISKMLQAMEELDAPEKMPEGLNPMIWERFCLIRRAKVESEQKVKTKALTLAEMQAFLQRRRDEDNTTQQEIKNLSEALESLHKERNYLLMDTMVQLILKQGQVEVPTIDLTAECSDFILYHRSVVDSLRASIRTLAEQKIASMVSCKDFRKGIIQLEWEHKVMRKQIEDLNDKMRDIKMLRLSEEQHDMAYLSKRDHKSRMSKQVSIMEKSIALMKKTHLKNVQQRIKKIEQINRQAALKAKKSAVLDQQLPDTQVTVAELKHICDATNSEEIGAAKREERYQQIVQMSNLKELARTQADDLAFLWSEVERLTRKNFPSLDQLKYN